MLARSWPGSMDAGLSRIATIRSGAQNVATQRSMQRHRTDRFLAIDMSQSRQRDAA